MHVDLVCQDLARVLRAGLGRYTDNELSIVVHVCYMVLVVRLLPEALATLPALEWSNVIMYHHVIVHVGTAQELLAAVRAVVELALSLRAVDHLERDERVHRYVVRVRRVGHDDFAPLTLLFHFILSCVA